MNIQTRAVYKKALREAGISTRGLTDDELEREYFAVNSGKQEAQPAPVEPLPTVIEKKKEAPKAATVTPINENATAQLAALLTQLGGNAGLSEARVLELIETHANAPKNIEITLKEAPKTDTVKIDCAHKSLEIALNMASAGVNTYLVGPAGTGKTTLAKQVAESLNYEFYFTGAVLQKYELLGFVDATGEYQKTPFYDWCVNGGVFLFDEIDASQPAALVAFNAALANGLICFPNNETIELHKNCVCFAAANTVGKGATRQYVGRNPIDAATLDRFCMLELDYDKELEAILTRKTYLENGGTDNDTDSAICSIVWDLRQKAINKKINVVISTRAMLKVAALCAKGMLMSTALELALYNSFTVDQRATLGVAK